MNQKQLANVLFAFLDLARFRIVGMVLVACAIAYILAYRGEFLVSRFLWTLIGTALITGGACALNCYIEREKDALMPRTCNRPIPAGMISPTYALVYGVSLVLIGSLLLFVKVNMLAGVFGLALVFIYLAIYTPAKRLTWMNTSIGALPGAIPPLIGWASARGQIDAGGWILFAMLFLWQHTHFFPIAWLYKDDYQKAGFRMLPVLESDGSKTFGLTLLSAIVLLPVSMLLYGAKFIGFAYGIGSIAASIFLIAAGIRLCREPSRAAARSVLFLSLFYLPVILAAVVLDRYCPATYQSYSGLVGAYISMDLSNAQISSIFHFATEQARTIVYLQYINLAICLGFLLTVVGLLTFAIIKFRQRPGDGEPHQSEGNTKLEITWTVIPALIFLFLGVLTGVVMSCCQSAGWQTSA